MSTKESNTKHNLFVISGPSGSGKGTLIKRVLGELKELSLSVSATTRKPRATETETKEYFFISQGEFERKIEQGEFLEWARVHSFLYGTLKQEVEQKFQSSDVILEIDPQGAMQVKEKRPDAILIFIRPPSLGILEQRLRERGTDSEEVIRSRLKDAGKELKQANNYNYVIINDYLDRASKKLTSIIQTKRSKHSSSPPLRGGD